MGEDDTKTRSELIAELSAVRRQVAELEDVRRRAAAVEAELRESQKRFKLALWGSHDGIWEWDRRTDAVFFSRRWKEMLGHADHEIENDIAEWKSRIHPDDFDMVMAANDRFFESGESLFEIEYRLRHKNGTYRWIHARGACLRDENGAPGLMAGAHTDITHRVNTEAALRESEEKYRAAFETNPDAVTLNRLDGSYVEVNEGFVELTGFTRDDVIGKPPAAIPGCVRPDHCRNIMADVKKTGSLKNYETRFRCKDGMVKIGLLSASMIQLNDGPHILSMTRDITERIQAEAEKEALNERLHQARKAESLSRMAGAVAHRLNNALSVVMGNLELAMAEMPHHTGVSNFLDNATQGAKKASDISGLMLTYLGQSRVKQVPVDLSGVCRKHLPVLDQELPEWIRVETDLWETGPVARANADQVRQILDSLIVNAAEAIGDRPGAVCVTTRNVESADIASTKRFPVSWEPKAHRYACLEVSDTGCGINCDAVNKIFDPFFTDKFPGRGLGLAVALGIVRTHGGAIGVESQPGQGSTFRVYLPLAEKREAAPADKAGRPIRTESGNTILLVEDQDMVRRMGERMIEHLGFEVLSAADGKAALELFQSHADRIACVITDLSLPEMDGWEILAAIREIDAEMPVILASGYDQSQAMNGRRNDLLQAFLHKPYRQADLKAAIARALES